MGKGFTGIAVVGPIGFGSNMAQGWATIKTKGADGFRSVSLGITEKKGIL